MSAFFMPTFSVPAYRAKGADPASVLASLIFNKYKHLLDYILKVWYIVYSKGGRNYVQRKTKTRSHQKNESA